MRPILTRYVPKIIRIPPLRKVIAQGGYFVCGMCKSPYPAIEDAFDCVHRCWQSFLSESPVVRRRAIRSMVYRCRLCGQHYHDINDGINCARRCLSRSDVIFAEELKMEKIPPKPLDSTFGGKGDLALRMMNRRYISRWKWKRQVDAPPPDNPAVETEAPIAAALPVAPPFESQSAAEAVLPHPEPEPVPLAPTATAPQKRRLKSSFKQGWSRANAKYVCEVCRTHYFTKVETNTCFDGHFDDAGLEILASA